MIPKQQAQVGFTLLEILLVMVMIAVTAAMIVPSISSISQGDVDDEARHLRWVLTYALEEAQLSGLPIRFVMTKQGWFFESYMIPARTRDGINSIEQKPKWQPLEQPPLVAYTLPDGIEVSRVEQAGDVEYGELTSTNHQQGRKTVLGMVLLLPDGTTSISNIYLRNKDEKQVALEVRPGPAGMRVKKEAEY